MNEIYRIDEDQDFPCESNRKNYENLFISAIADTISNVLDISYREQRIVNSLLITCLKETINGRYKEPGLLQQYLASQLDILAESLIGELDLPKDTKVNHGHVTYAKFSDIIKVIKNKHGTKEQSKRASR